MRFLLALLPLAALHAQKPPNFTTRGDLVRAFNDRGSLRLRAHVNGGIASGVVAARLGWNKLSASGHNVNLLTSQRLNDLAGGPVFYSVLVEVRKAEGAQTAEAAD